MNNISLSLTLLITLSFAQVANANKLEQKSQTSHYVDIDGQAFIIKKNSSDTESYTYGTKEHLTQCSCNTKSQLFVLQKTTYNQDPFEDTKSSVKGLEAQSIFNKLKQLYAQTASPD